MTRTTALKLGYIAVFLLLTAMAAAGYFWSGQSGLVLIIIVLILLLPGRVQGIYFRDFFTGRRLMNLGRAEESIPEFERFLATLDEHPRRGWALWLSWSMYTVSAKAMTLNNLAASYLELGDQVNARRYIEQSLAIDPLYPIPYINLAVLEELKGNHELVGQAIEKSEALGYRGGSVDQVIYKAQSLLARVEGRATC